MSCATSDPADLESQTIKLPDGRILGFAEYGARSGSPLLFFHGFPTSRLEAKGVANLVTRLNIRLISVDRPGYGLSTFQPHRCILDWPSDVQALTSQLGIQRFSILGGSGGGPYAVACAYKLPAEMMRSVGLFASAGPWESGIQDVPWSAYLLYLSVTFMPWLSLVASDATIGSLRRLLSTGPATKWIERWLEKVAKTAKARSATEESVSCESSELAESSESTTIQQRREQLLKIGFEAFSQGSAGFVQDAQLLSQPWGFRFEDVTTSIKIWHGTNDTNAPIQQIRWMAERLPHCQLYEMDDDHFTLMRHMSSVLEELISSEIVRDAASKQLV